MNPLLNSHKKKVLFKKKQTSNKKKKSQIKGIRSPYLIENGIELSKNTKKKTCRIGNRTYIASYQSLKSETKTTTTTFCNN